MQSLKQKIKKTTLFSDEDKIAILVAVDGYSASDVKALEKIVDEFDQAHTRAVTDYKKAVYGVLEDIVVKQKSEDAPRMQGATDQIKQGIRSIFD